MLAVLFHRPHALHGLDARAQMAGLAARVVAVGEAAMLGVLAAVDNELKVAHRGRQVSK